MKKFTKILLLIFLLGELNAQEVSVPDLSIVEDATLQNCKTEKVESVSTTRYENEAKSFLRFAPSPSENINVYLNNSEGEIISEYLAVNSTVLIEGLALNSEYIVKGVDNCDNEYLIANITTFSPSDDFINVPPNLFTALIDRTKMEDPPNLCEYLQTIENVDFHEKTAYLQQFSYQNALLPPGFEICVVPPPPPPACNCKFVIRGFYNVSSGNRPSMGTEIIPANNSEYPRKYNYSELAWGPSRYNFLEFGDRCVHSGNPVRFGVENGNASTYDAFIRVMLQCENRLELPEDCGCNRTFNLDYEYEAALFAQARSRTHFWCGWGGHLARAHVEDWVILTLEKPGDVQVLNAARAGAESRCNSSANPEFFLSLIQIASGIAAAIGNPTIGQIDTIAQNIANILDDSGFTQNGSCGSINNQYAMRSNNNIEISPNELTCVYLSSFFVVEGDGATKFHTESKIGSNFRMSLAHPGGSKNEDPFCCADTHAWWLSAAAHGVDEHNLNLPPSSGNTFSPGTQQNMITGINSHLFPVLGAIVNTPCGELFEDVVCPIDGGNEENNDEDWIITNEKFNPVSNQVIGQTNSLSIESDEFNESKTLIEDIKLFPNPFGDILHIQVPQSDDNYNLKIFNTYGQMIYNSNLKSDKLSQVDLRDLSNGLYIVKLLNNKTLESVSHKVMKLTNK